MYLNLTRHLSQDLREGIYRKQKSVKINPLSFVSHDVCPFSENGSPTGSQASLFSLTFSDTFSEKIVNVVRKANLREFITVIPA